MFHMTHYVQKKKDKLGPVNTFKIKNVFPNLTKVMENILNYYITYTIYFSPMLYFYKAE